MQRTQWMPVKMRGASAGCETTAVLLLASLVFLTTEINGEIICKEGYNYPISCPDPDYPRCCRHYNTPACCEQRAKKACVRSKHKKYSTTGGLKTEIHPDHSAVWCPRPGQSDDHMVCSYNNRKLSCMSTQTLAGILGGVFGGLALIGVIVTAVCCYMVKSGRWVRVKIRPGKWQVMSRQRADAFRQHQTAVALPTINTQQAVAPPPGSYPTAAYPSTAPPSYASVESQSKSRSAPPPSYATSIQNPANSQTQYWNPVHDGNQHKY